MGSGLVETEFLFERESFVDREGKRNKGTKKIKTDKINESLGVLRGKKGHKKIISDVAIYC